MADDKNTPQAITVDYPENEAKADPSYLIIERDFGLVEKSGRPKSARDLLGPTYGAFGEKHKEKGT